MVLRLVQLRLEEGARAVAALAEDGSARRVEGETVLALAQAAVAAGTKLADQVTLAEPLDVRRALEEGRVLPPIDHPDPAHLFLTGTGLTHLGSAEERDRMHAKLAHDGALTDSMKMFKLGLDGGRPTPGEAGVQPEWFYKGDGAMLAAPGAPLESPDFALDGGDEAEIAAIYLIGPGGTPHRLGFALANEFSDHVTEQANYLYLAHSKLRPAAIGPELRVGPLPNSVHGRARIRRDGGILWEKDFLTGEAHMSHSLANLEAHHFKYDLFRRPGDVHVHFLGAAALSFAAGVCTAPGDRFEIEADAFVLPLANTLSTARTAGLEIVAL